LNQKNGIGRACECVGKISASHEFLRALPWYIHYIKIANTILPVQALFMYVD